MRWLADLVDRWILARHSGIPTLDDGWYRMVCPQHHWSRPTAWPCPDWKAALDRIGRRHRDD